MFDVVSHPTGPTSRVLVDARAPAAGPALHGHGPAVAATAGRGPAGGGGHDGRVPQYPFALDRAGMFSHYAQPLLVCHVLVVIDYAAYLDEACRFSYDRVVAQGLPSSIKHSR